MPQPQLEGETFLIVGLGNPGGDYRDTRHNVGQMVCDQIAALFNAEWRGLSEGAVVEGRRGNKLIVVAKPPTFVNTSGLAVRKLADKFNVIPSRLLVIHDDLDLDFAVLRIRQGGSSGGHRGLNSIIAALGTDDFIRLKVGIGRPPGRMDPADFVLSPFTPAEWPQIEVSIAITAEAALAAIDEGVEPAMNLYNRKKDEKRL